MLPATRQRLESRFYPQPKQVLDLRPRRDARLSWPMLHESGRLGFEPATCQLQVQRPTAAPTRNTVRILIALIASMEATTTSHLAPPSLTSMSILNVRWPRHMLPLVSRGKYADGTDRQTNRRTDARPLHYAFRHTLFLSQFLKVAYPILDIRVYLKFPPAPQLRLYRFMC